MMTVRRRQLLLVTALLAGAAAVIPPPSLMAQQFQVDFNQHIRPLLANSCFKCHGPDALNRQAELRLDERVHATQPRDGGPPAIVPGNRQSSPLFRRIVSQDPTQRMPPAGFVQVHGGQLTADQVELIGRWIDAGAQYARHWSYQVPRLPELPTVRNTGWPRTAIDFFILDRLERANMAPSESARKHELLRRLCLDLTGLPPTEQQQATFLADDDPTAYQQLVERLLASPRFGERMAVHWLDLARYADTHGYHIDSHRDMWRWRDWVIRAFNRDMPFDQFTIEQLAGDLLPGATASQLLATGFHRNTMLNFEGGAIAEEYLVEYVSDRVITTSTVWLGQTMECCRCHDHKYDPLSQLDFYRMFAYFNNIDEQGLDGRTGNAAPLLKSPTELEQQQQRELAQRLAAIAAEMAVREQMVDTELARWQSAVIAGDKKIPGPPTDVLAHWPLDLGPADRVLDRGLHKMHGAIKGEPLHVPGKFGEALLFDGAKHVETRASDELNRQDRFTLACWIFPTSQDAQGLLSAGKTGPEARGYHLLWNEGRLRFQLINQPRISLLDVEARDRLKLSQWYHVAVTTDGTQRAAGVQIYLDGRPIEVTVEEDSLAGSVATSEPFLLGSQAGELKMRGLMDDVRIYGRQLDQAEVARLAGGNPIRELIDIPAAERTREQQQQLRQYFLDHHDPYYKKRKQQRQQLIDSQEQLDRRIATTMVMRERAQPRPSFLLRGGNYLQKGEQVQAGVPTVLGDSADRQNPNRLDLARWLVSPENPLTARVTVNRLWLLLMGEGLVRTPRDFGTRGAWPTHPELLDYLAVTFQRDGWSVKDLVRSIVLSATYRQTSRVSELARQRDPENEYWSHALQLRLEAEMVRDQALFFAGVLDPEVGGPSVFPYHPPGLWREVSFNPRDFSAQVYRQSEGEDLYRRSVYTFWKRAVPPPALATFGAPNRETCVVQRPRDRSPLQALVLMNDPTYTESARLFAARLLRSDLVEDSDRLDWLYQVLFCRPIEVQEEEVLLGLLSRQRRDYRAEPEEARRLVLVGDYPLDESLAAVELASWTNVVATLLMTDEALFRP